MVDEITDTPDPDDFRQDLEDLLDELEHVEELPDVLLEELDDIWQQLDDAESYEEISEIASSIQDTLDDYSDYSNYSQRAGDISSGAGSSTGSVNLTEIRAGIRALEKRVKDLEKRVDGLRDYNELMLEWESRVDERLAELESIKESLGCGWDHQVNGFSLKTGTVNFVTEVD